MTKQDKQITKHDNKHKSQPITKIQKQDKQTPTENDKKRNANNKQNATIYKTPKK